MNGRQSRNSRRMAEYIREKHKQDVEALIAEWPWYKRTVSWIVPKLGERWATKELDRAKEIDDFAQRRTYKWLKRHI